MAGKEPFALAYDPEVKEHLTSIPSKYHSLIRATIEGQLRFEPETETQNRKPLQGPLAFPEATWELRLGPDNRFRVFYLVAPERREVQILAIGVKSRSRLRIGGVEIEL